MSVYQAVFAPLCGGLTLLGLIASWFAWRRRGAAAGLRGVAWSLVPLAIYLLGIANLLWRFGSAIASFAASFVFSPLVWSGVIVAGLSLILFAVSGGLRKRRGRKPAGPKPAGAAPARPGAAGAPAASPSAKQAKRKGKAGDDDDLSDVADILRRHGIR